MRRIAITMLRLACAISIAAAALAVAANDPPLIEAVKAKDAARVHTLIDRKADVNATAPDQATALHWAAYQDDVETARLLLQNGANADAANRYGVTPLSLACTNGSARMIGLLLESGAGADRALPDGSTPLMIAARTGNPEAVDLLLKRGVEVNRVEPSRGQTALMWAAAEGHLAVVRQLIQAGANVSARSTGGWTALLFAVREGKPDVVKALLAAGANVNDTLPLSSRRPRGGGSDAAVHAGSSALHVAVTNAHFELAAMLLDAGANPNASGPGWTPLHAITWVRQPGTGSNDPAPPGSGNMDSLELVRRLAAHGANVNARMTRRTSAGLSSLNMIGATPFLMAARTGDAGLMRLLAKLGADPLMPNEDGSTPLMVAAGLGTRSPGEDAGSESEALEAVKVALELGNDPNAVDRNGETAMHGAAYKQLPAVAKYLAEHGARIEVWNRKNSKGWTPLRIAEGVHRTGNFRSSPETAAVLREVMRAAGVSTEVEPETLVSGTTQ
jgi:ankyrin repeat protein